MKNLTLVLAIIILTTACKNTSKKDVPLTAQEIIERSIEYYHMEDWGSFSGKFKISQTIPEAKEEDEAFITLLEFDNSKQYFRLERPSLEQIFGVKDGVLFAEVKGEDALHKDVSELNITSMKSYWTYLLGIPAKLKDPGSVPNDTIKKVSFREKDHWLVTIPYEKETWSFYFNSNTYALQKACFIMNQNPSYGNCIEFEKEIEVNNIKFQQEQHWYDLDGKKLGEEVIEASSLY
ncbi:DUF6503 family protein [Leptobacterium sp. I13]|uniref:DUF6503 family protein n=1 Tax=Leptobacterium meishanense TaxID=3128904 RepID=UPI0030EF17AA